MKLVLAMFVALLCCSGVALAQEVMRADSILLNGTWQFAVGQGEEQAETAAGQARLTWQSVSLPGSFLPWSKEAARTIKFVWARRSFRVSSEQAGRLAILNWDNIDFGAVAYINGQQVGENEPTGPYQVALPAGALKAGNNEIVLRIAGAAGVRKSKSGHFLIPAGFADQHPVGMPAVHDNIWIDFADGAYIKSALARPDLAASKVRFRVTIEGPASLDGADVHASVASWPQGEPAGEGDAAVGKGEMMVTVEVPMPNFKPWTYETPNLYTADLMLMKGGESLDAISFRFGMREVKIEGGRYRLNGKDLWLRGADLVGEWTWGDSWLKGKEKQYLVTEAREMNINSFRTHTQPPSKLVADTCDESGQMLLAEMRCLYNGSNFHFTPAEYEIFHQNVLKDARAWITRLWNHPSIVTWVLSNESDVDNQWEEGPYRDFVRELDPTRPTMRTDNETAEIYDVHQCTNTVDTCEGKLQAAIPSWFARARGRAVTNTEYMNLFPRPVTQWTGTEDKDADAVAYGELGLEHTEAMRRARLAGIWAYMYAGWTKLRHSGKEWKAGYAQPISAALHSAFSPVLASLDMFDANYLTGQTVTTDLYLINDSWHDAKIHVDLILTKEDPQLIPEAACLKQPVLQWSFDFALPADSRQKVPVKWEVPDAVGAYWLTARTTGLPGRPVLSTRMVRAIAPPVIDNVMRSRNYIVLGGGGKALDTLRALGLRVDTRLLRLIPGRDVVVIWDAAKVTPEEMVYARRLRDFAAQGGQIVALASTKWDWPELCDVSIPQPKPGWGEETYVYSRAFPYDADNPPAALRGLPKESLMRWNGLPGTVALAPVQGPPLDWATKIAWARDRKHVVAASGVPLVAGGGTMTFCQLLVQTHLDPKSPTYDPAAEQIFLNLLAPPPLLPSGPVTTEQWGNRRDQPREQGGQR